MIPVEGHKHLYRDEKSGAIVNCDNTGYNMSGMYGQNGSGMNVANQVNQGDTIVGTSNHMNLEKSVNHGDFTSILTFNEGAYLAAGGQSNN